MIPARMLQLLGFGPVFATARSIAQHKFQRIIEFDIHPNRIHETDVAVLIGPDQADVEVFAAMGLHALNHARSDLVEKIAGVGREPTRLVHPGACIDSSATLGVNVLVAAGATIGPGCVVGDGCVILDGARIEAGAQIECYAWMGANTVIGFEAVLGSHSILRMGVHIDAGVRIGHHCELSKSGLRQRDVQSSTFEASIFEAPVRMFSGRHS